MKFIFFVFFFTFVISMSAQISPFTDYDWTIDKIVNSDGSVVLADQLQDGTYDMLLINYSDITSYYNFFMSQCIGSFGFFDNSQSFEILGFSCVITPNHTEIANHFLNIFILQEGGETQTSLGTVYGPFLYDFTYSGNLAYLHVTNLAGSVATFYAENLNQQEFLKESISIYPNPVVEVLNIDNSGIAIDRLKIYDLSGRLVLEKENVKHQMNVSQLQQGIYIITIETAVGVLREKLVKK